MPRSPQFAPSNAKVKAKPTGGTLADEGQEGEAEEAGLTGGQLD